MGQSAPLEDGHAGPSGRQQQTPLHSAGTVERAPVCLVKSPLREYESAGTLAGRLAGLADPRHRRGRRHLLVSVLLVAASAVLAGARSYAAIGQWARSAPQDALARLGARIAGVLQVRVPPSTAQSAGSSP
ncbi:transposase family protein [Actinacidiphila glaucinigra]|uniref:transposase family protein n=1 Tax=Actinacidiphila glaucinigra TaxID=235986 RepID=UPI0035D86E5B